jgi:hypothetical protein
MNYLKKIAAGAGIAGALAVAGLGLATGVANADDWGYGPYGPDGGNGYGWAGAPGYGPGNGYGPGYGYNGACAWMPPFVSQWIPPAACGG